MVNRLLIISIFGLVLTACVAEAQKKIQQDIPPWINDPYATFSEDEYLLAVGSGSTQQEAQNNALANLSKIFQSNIETSQKMIDDFTELSQNNSYISERSTQLLTVTRVGSSQNLINTKIIKMHQSNDRFYALAGMERFDTSRIYSSEIADNEIQINNLISQAENEDNALYKLGYLKKALILAEVNLNLASQKRIIQGMGSSDMHQITHNRVSKMFNDAKKNTKVAINFDNETHHIVRSGIVNALDISGLTVTNSLPSQLIANVTFTTERTNLNRRNAEFSRWNLSISFENARNEPLYTYTANGREGGLSYSDALHRAREIAKETMENELPGAIENNILSN